jgi:hypothetical protein
MSNPEKTQPSRIDPSELQTVRELARRWAECAADPANARRREAWNDLNHLRPGRPLVYIYQIPWEELDACRASVSHPDLAPIEEALRQRLWQWEHFPADFLLDDTWYVTPAFGDSGFGMRGAATRTEGYRTSAHFEPVLHSLADVEKIQDPVVTLDQAQTQRRLRVAGEVFDGIAPTALRGICRGQTSAWDKLMKWYGIDKLMIDMIEQPELVHAAIGRMTDAMLSRLDQWESLGLVTTGNGNYTIGNGGLAIYDALPGYDGEVRPARADEIWGSSMAQIFSEVSPAMHDEFALTYEKKWLSRFGPVAYGCCEPLHDKIDIIRRIPRVRRVSVSPWADTALAAERIGTDMVFSLKPNPTDVCAPRFDLEAARKALRETLAACRGCRVEIILKDLHTLHRQPERLDAWAAMAMEEADRAAR